MAFCRPFRSFLELAPHIRVKDRPPPFPTVPSHPMPSPTIFSPLPLFPVVFCCFPPSSAVPAVPRCSLPSPTVSYHPLPSPAVPYRPSLFSITAGCPLSSPTQICLRLSGLSSFPMTAILGIRERGWTTFCRPISSEGLGSPLTAQNTGSGVSGPL